ncbi:MAG: ECF-type sigma factor [Planctomycetota bacterium]
MVDSAQRATTAILLQAAKGEVNAAEEFTKLVHDELTRLAASYLRAERRDHTFSPSDLVGEAYSRLIDQTRTDWRSRQHFLAVAAQQMSRVLIDHARARNALKRPPSNKRVPLTGLFSASTNASCETTELADALAELRVLHQRQAEVVELRFFSGLTVREVADQLGVHERTVAEDWRMARAWLHEQLAGDDELTGGDEFEGRAP